MNIEAIKKAMKDAGVDDGVITAVEGLDNSAEVERLTGELKAEQGKSAQILADKKKFKEQAEAADAKAKELENSNLTVDEKYQKQIDALKADVQSAKDESAAKDALAVKNAREAKLSEIAAGLKGADGVQASTLNTLVKSQLAEIEDLGDNDAVTAKINDLKDNNKGLFAADVPAGEGGQHNSGGGGGGSEKSGGYVKDVWAKTQQ